MTAIKFDQLATADDATINKAITSLHRRSETLQLDVHKLLVSVCARWASTGDVRPAVTHINTLLTKGKLGGMRCNAIREWVEVYMGFKIIEDGDNKGQFKAGGVKGDKLNMQEIATNRWWEFKPEPQYQPMDFDKLFSQLMAKAKKRASNAKESDNVDAGLLAALEEAKNQYNSDNVTH